MPPRKQAFGIDVGGSGIKGALVDISKGELLSERFRLDTPQPSTPEAVARACGEVAANVRYTGPVGLDFPGVVRGGVVLTAANVDKNWIGTSLVGVTEPFLPGPVTALNDADAAGLAEARFGAGKGHRGLVLMITLGTGIGTALVHDGRLIPNAELGHIEIDGHDAESRAAASVRERKDLSWEDWAKRVEKYLRTLEKLLWPELIILGGGVSKKADKWLPMVRTETELAVATMLNNAGIIGSALAAVEGVEPG